MGENRPGTLRRTVYFSGTVQGVGFRYTTHRVAARYDVTGFVRNLPDGRVELVAEGPAAEVRGLLDAIRAEMGHYIGDTQERTSTASGRFGQFEIRF